MPLDPDRLPELCVELTPSIYAFSEMHLRRAGFSDPRDLAQDVAQECWLRFVQSPDRFHGPPEELPRWLFGICRNVLHEALFKASRKMVTHSFQPGESSPGLEPLVAQITTVTHRVRSDEVMNLFLRRVASLEEAERDLVELRGLARHSWAEIATLLEEPEPTLRQRWRRLLQRLKEEGLPKRLAIHE